MIEFKSGSQQQSLSVDLTPLIDVVFQLLVFFLLTSAFITTGITVELPDAQTGESGDETTLSITIDEAGAIFVGPDEASLEELERILQSEATVGKVLRIAVWGDVELRYGLFMKVLDLCRQAGLNDVVLMVRPEASSP